jgi:hypothetical protein
MKKYHAVRIAGLCAACINADASRKLAGRVAESLLIDAYRLEGVFIDSAATVELAMFGVANMYPLTAISRFSAKSIRKALKIRTQLHRVSCLVS